MVASVDASQYLDLVKRLKGLDDKKVQRMLRKRLRDAVGPVGRRIIEKGAEQMPSHGGLQHLIQQYGRPRTALMPAGVRLDLRNAKASLAALNRGILRHPVFARADRERKDWAWTQQSVPEEAFSAALEDLAPELQPNLAKVMGDIMKELG